MTTRHGNSRQARHAMLICVTTLGTSAATADIEACKRPDGSHLYTQFGCPSGTEPAGTKPGEAAGKGSLSIISSPGLTDEQRRALKQLDSSLTRERQARRQANARRAREWQGRRAEAQARCAEAQSALARLEATRRKGYNAAEGRRFDAEELKWRRVRRSSC